MALHIDFDGRDYVYDPAALTVKQAIVIKGHTGFGLVQWQAAIREMDPSALQAMMWVLKVQAGEQTPIADVDFNVDAFIDAISAATDDTPQAAVADPTHVGTGPTGESTPST